MKTGGAGAVINVFLDGVVLQKEWMGGELGLVGMGGQESTGVIEKDSMDGSVRGRVGSENSDEELFEFCMALHSKDEMCWRC